MKNIILNNCDSVDLLDYSEKYWTFCLVIAVAGNASEIYFSKEDQEYRNIFMRNNEYFYLPNPDPIAINEILNSFSKLFSYNCIDKYINNGSIGSISLTCNSTTIYAFAWENVDEKCFTIKTVFDDEAPYVFDNFIKSNKQYFLNL
jgi:hypothetical protein